MSSCIEKISCEDCGSSDAKQVFLNNDDKYTAYCFACDTYDDDPYKDGTGPAKAPAKRSRESIEAELRFIQTLGYQDIEHRKLRKETLEHFEVRVGVSEVDGSTPTFMHFPYTKRGELTAYKTKIIVDGRKSMWSTGDMAGCDLFGWRQAMLHGGRTLFITEGEEDAMALFQAILDKQRGTKFADLLPCVVSLSKGAGHAGAEIAAHRQEIVAQFQDVVLVFDMDEAGQKAREAVIQVIPHATAADLPAKDANDAVMRGFSKKLAEAVLFRKGTQKNSRLVFGRDVKTAARLQAEMGLSLPWSGLTELTRGVRPGETWYFGAGVKMGKSEVVNALATHFILEHDKTVFMAKPEESNNKTFKLLCGKAAGKVFHDPNVDFDYEAYDRVAPKLEDKVVMLDLYQHVGWETLRADIVVAATQLGAEVIIIDPITNLTNGLPAAEANVLLQAIAQDLSALAKDLGLIIFIFCHLKSPETGASHERGGKVMSHQFAGSRAMMRSCNFMVGIEGNKDPELSEEERNIRDLVVLEDREFGSSGIVRIWWNRITSLFTELESK